MELTSVCTDCGAVFLADRGRSCSGRHAALALMTPTNAGGAGARNTRASQLDVPSEMEQSDADLTSTHRQEAGGTPVTARQRLAALLSHLPKSRCARLQAELAGVRAELNSLDRGLIDVGVALARANAQISAAITVMKVTPEQAAELIERARRAGEEQAGTTLEIPRPGGLPARHPESLGRELVKGDNDLFAAYCADDLSDLQGLTPDGPGAS